MLPVVRRLQAGALSAVPRHDKKNTCISKEFNDDVLVGTYVLKPCLVADARRMVLETVTAYLRPKTYSDVDANRLSTSSSNVLDPQVRRHSKQQEDYGYQTFKHHQYRPTIVSETQNHHENTIFPTGEMYGNLEKRYRP